MIDKEKLKAWRMSGHPTCLYEDAGGKVRIDWQATHVEYENRLLAAIDSGELDADMEAAWGCKGCFFNSERSTSLCHNWQKDDICIKCANFERSKTDAKP